VCEQWQLSEEQCSAVEASKMAAAVSGSRPRQASSPWVASEQGLGPEGTWIEVVEAEVTTPEDTDSEPEYQD